jgi:hypothetical protein
MAPWYWALSAFLVIGLVMAPFAGEAQPRAVPLIGFLSTTRRLQMTASRNIAKIQGLERRPAWGAGVSSVGYVV